MKNSVSLGKLKAIKTHYRMAWPQKSKALNIPQSNTALYYTL